MVYVPAHASDVKQAPFEVAQWIIVSFDMVKKKWEGQRSVRAVKRIEKRMKHFGAKLDETPRRACAQSVIKLSLHTYAFFEYHKAFFNKDKTEFDDALYEKTVFQSSDNHREVRFWLAELIQSWKHEKCMENVDKLEFVQSELRTYLYGKKFLYKIYKLLAPRESVAYFESHIFFNKDTTLPQMTRETLKFLEGVQQIVQRANLSR